MGKLTDALKKVEKQREIEKQAWRDKAKAQPCLDERRDTIRPNKQRLEAAESQKATRRSSPEKWLGIWDGGIKALLERLKNRVYIAKATDD